MIKRAFISWFLGVIAWMFGVVLSVYDGIGSFIFQPIIGGVIFAVAVAAATPLSLLSLRVPVVQSLVRSWIPCAILLAVGFVLVGYSGSDSFAGHYTDPETGETFRILSPGLAYAGFACFVFGPLFSPIGVRHETKPAA